MKVKLPKDKYIQSIEVNDDSMDIKFKKKKKVALLFVSLNERYWPYLRQVVEDCKKNFLPHHKVDYHIWSDMPEDVDYGGTLYPTEGIEWPAPTLMRYHLFLQQEEELKDYDYIFYLDSDMRVVQKISDDILGKALTAAPHPGYALNSKLIPPYEPNPASQAYIHRLGRVTKDEKGQERFIPFYAAGGFQGGTAKTFLKAMRTMKKMIDRDFDNNYTAIWNDESHWNKYLWEYQRKGGDINFLDVSYIYPDSLIKEYYETIWGYSPKPKIITLTKPFSLSKSGSEHVKEILGMAHECPSCHDRFEVAGHRILKILSCPGSGKPHQMDMQKL